MPERGGRIHTFLETVSIAEVERERATIAARFFVEAELAELRGKRAQTMAGFLALKRAMARLAASLSGDSPSEKDFALTHSRNGAPVCATPASALEQLGICRERLYLSVSHTREWAYGLAAYQEAVRG